MSWRWRSWRPWIRWSIGGVGGVLLLSGLAVLYVWYQISSISLADIQARQQVKQGSDVPALLSPILNDSIDKANQIASKPIAAQDALDVASILMKAGLSMKEVYYLLGKSSETLSNEEKQKIRDMVMAKLSKEEIDTLRTITKPYGKGLVILDPSYPIELVGVYDPKKREEIIQELTAQGRWPIAKPKPTAKPVLSGSTSPTASQPSSQPGATPVFATPTTAPALSNATQKPVPSETAAAAASASPTAPSSGPAKADSDRQAQIEAKYSSQLQTLQASCENRVNRLIGEISASLQKSKDSANGLDSLKSEYLVRVVEEEQACSTQFEALLGQAEKELKQNNLDISMIAKWRKDYENAKQQAQVRALQQLKKALQ
jgi:hypothetical protein